MFKMIFGEACVAALDAFDNCRPTPMVVGQSTLFSNEIIPGTEEVVPDGPCGFAWIKIKPARGPFIKFLKENNIGGRDEYEGGYRISFHDICPTRSGSQSMMKKEAGTRAFVQTIKKYFPEMKISSHSRMD